MGNDGDVESNYNNSLDTENDEISSQHQDSKETTLISQSQDTGTDVGEAAVSIVIQLLLCSNNIYVWNCFMI